jgi:hypothetical protein
MEQIKDINDTINEIIDSYKLGNNGMPPGAIPGPTYPLTPPPYYPPPVPTYDPASMFSGMPPGAIPGPTYPVTYPPSPPREPTYDPISMFPGLMPPGAIPGALPVAPPPEVQQPTYQNPYGPEVQQPTYQTPYGPTYPPAPTREPTYDPASMFGGLSPDLQSALLSVLKSNSQKT